MNKVKTPFHISAGGAKLVPHGHGSNEGGPLRQDTNQTNPDKSCNYENKVPIDLTSAVPSRCALVVDDDYAIRELVAYALELVGFIVSKAEDGQQAYDMFLGGNWDLVVTDYKMPFMDGITLIKKIHQCSPSTPCILMSGVLSNEFSDILDTGAVLEKPFTVHELHREVMRVMA